MQFRHSFKHCTNPSARHYRTSAHNNYISSQATTTRQRSIRRAFLLWMAWSAIDTVSYKHWDSRCSFVTLFADCANLPDLSFLVIALYIKLPSVQTVPYFEGSQFWVFWSILPTLPSLILYFHSVCKNYKCYVYFTSFKTLSRINLSGPKTRWDWS